MRGDVDLQLINCKLHVYIAVNTITFHKKLERIQRLKQ